MATKDGSAEAVASGLTAMSAASSTLLAMAGHLATKDESAEVVASVVTAVSAAAPTLPAMAGPQPLTPFRLERFFAKHEFSAPYLLCCSDMEALTMKELLAMADPEMQQKCVTLHLSAQFFNGATPPPSCQMGLAGARVYRVPRAAGATEGGVYSVRVRARRGPPRPHHRLPPRRR